MNQSPLHSFHTKLGARMVDYAGWSMPLMYRGIIEEHKHTRSQCSLFDVSHMGRLYLAGGDSEALLQKVCTRNVGEMPVGLSRYTHICREDGGILDDVIVSRFEDQYLVVCNAANREKITNWLKAQSVGMDVTLTDRTLETAMIALQGPQAIAQVEKLLKLDLSDLKRYHFLTRSFMTFKYAVFRSGYTGEDGVELILPVNLVKLAMSALVGLCNRDDAVVLPAGLGARDSLRLEAGMPLYGHELTEDWDSLTARQGWCVHLDTDFVGADVMRDLKAGGLKRKIVGLQLEGRRTARQGFVVKSNGEAVGQVTSGVLSPTLGKSIALALVDISVSKVGTPLAVEFGSKEIPASVVKIPFYKLQS
ncbi:MAG: glycine cleavage system aminomethyltransferase GcvT [Planctomycetes bacterium]|nr:glycine cleavage system aminomethyltransferase GcvT [Planctomycetota bacterium]